MDAEPSPESGDLEIITSSDLPPADGADAANGDVADAKTDNNAADASPPLDPSPADPTMNDANVDALHNDNDNGDGDFELAQHNDEPAEAALDASDPAANDTTPPADAAADDDEAKADTIADVGDGDDGDDFVAINDPLNVTQETDLTQHSKAGSVDMFSFFSMPGTGAADDAVPTAEETIGSKRAESMGGLHKLDIDDINISQLAQQQLEDHARDSDTQLTDSADRHAALAEYGDDPGVPPDEHDASTADRLRSGTAVEVPFEEDPHYDIDADEDDHTNTGALPGAAPTHVSRRSIHDLVNDELEKEMRNDPELAAIHHQSTLGDVGIGGAEDAMEGGNMGMGMDYDMAMGMGMGMGAEAHLSDDEHHAGGMASEQKWMDMAKTWMQKERELNAQMRDLEDELNAMDDEKQAMLIAHEKQLAQQEQEAKEQSALLERQLADAANRAQMESERLLADNQSMAADVSILRDELAKERERADDLQSTVSDQTQQLEEADLRWSQHISECPLLNSDVAAAAEEKRTAEISKYELGSQQMSQSVTRLIAREKELEDEIAAVREENATRQQQVEQSNAEMSRLRDLLDKAKAEANRNAGALNEAKARASEEERRRLEAEQELGDLGNAYDMLQAFSNEQSAILEQAEVPSGVDPAALAAVKQKKSILASKPVGPIAGRNRSFGGMSEFVEHMRNLSTVSDVWRNQGKYAESKEDDVEAAETASSFSDDVSIASNFTRWSFRRYHTHDATREFFFLLALCVKLSLAHKYGVSPDVAPGNDQLWKQALAADVAFHEYPEFLRMELSNLYEFKRGQYKGLIRNVVITDKSKIAAQEEQRKRMERLEKDVAAQGVVQRMYESYALGDKSAQGRLQAAQGKRDRTYFSPNDDLFGGHTKVTTRANRELKIRQRNSSRGSQRSQRSQRSGRSSKRSSRKVKEKAKRRRSREKEESRREPGNSRDAQIHPLNDDGVGRRDSEKLDGGGDAERGSKKRGYHLTQKSLEVLDPNKNPHI